MRVSVGLTVWCWLKGILVYRADCVCVVLTGWLKGILIYRGAYFSLYDGLQSIFKIDKKSSALRRWGSE
jgi:hypothetical protein